MTVWHTHFLNARNSVTRILPEVRTSIRAAISAASDHVELPRMDLVIRTGTEVIPDWGVAGNCPAPGLINLTIDPDRYNPDYVVRTLVHEFHHLIRWDGPGYGKSLGEALVSEGLAGHFVLQVLGGKPDPWDAVNPSQGLARRASNEWSRLGYDHAEWFFGSGKIRKWSGYGLGHRLIAEHLAANPDQTPVTLATARADDFRSAMRSLAKTDGEAPAEDEETPAETSET